jgi:carbon starvation protein
MTDVAFLKNQITGAVVGVINIFMLILNVVMIVSFLKNFGAKTAKADA